MIPGNTEEAKRDGYEFPEGEEGFFHIHVVNRQASRDGQSVEVVLNNVLKDTPLQYKMKTQRNAYAFGTVELYHDPTKEEKPKAKSKTKTSE